MERCIVHSIQWCDARDIIADGRTKGSSNRDMLLQVMGGMQSFKHDFKRHTPYRAGQTTSSEAA
eukprot:6481549-Pyramimonas_sp.AAC.1